MSENFVEHTLNPIFDCNSRVLILGTMPSPRAYLKTQYNRII